MEMMSKLKELIPFKEMTPRWKRSFGDEIISLRNDIDRLFDRFVANPFETDWWTRSRGPAFDLEETDEHVIVRAEMPGVDPKDLDVSVREGELHVKYEKEERRTDGDYAARKYGAFTQSFALPNGLDTANATATCKHGVLTVKIPRTPESRRQVRRITVQS
jgi:HSP20 family protein